MQEIIARDPSIIGLGNLILKDKERIQPQAGRLDILLQDEDTNERYEVEIQLGKTNESHIIRTIEYWDKERNRYPMYDHYAVIVAEDITSRFLNVIGLFNRAIPLIAIQMSAIKTGDNISLFFIKLLDTTAIDSIDEEASEVTDRNYWEKKATKQTVALADEILELIKTISPDFELKYNKFYIGLAHDGQPNNFAIFRPKKNHVRLELRIPKSKEIESKIEAADLDMLDYDNRWGKYRIRLNKEEIKRNKEVIIDLLKIAYQKQSS